MTKLFSRTFAASPEDVRIDNEISEKICLLQTFLKPEHLDIPALLRNEASWLVCIFRMYIYVLNLATFLMAYVFNFCLLIRLDRLWLRHSHINILFHSANILL